MDREINFEYEFATLENAMKFAGDDEEKAIITKDHLMYYVVDCARVNEFLNLGFEHV